jgi:myo-inositol-1(or 4)-monophosphatase
MPGSEQPDTLLSAAMDFARRGGRLALERFGKAQASCKADMTIVTEADLAVQELIIAAVAQQFPGHAVLGEEAGSEAHALPLPERAEFCWVVDPIDGTRNYYRGFPCFSTSVGLLRKGTPVVGAVYDPLLDRMYYGTVGGGAFVDGQPLCAKNEPAHTNSLIGVPSGHSRRMPRVVHDWLDRLNLRNTGSAALHLAYVAAGWLDAAYAKDCRIWDVAAGWVLVREAGAVITGPEGSDLFPAMPAALAGERMPFLAAGPKLHAELLKTVDRIGGKGEKGT